MYKKYNNYIYSILIKTIITVIKLNIITLNRKHNCNLTVGVVFKCKVNRIIKYTYRFNMKKKTTSLAKVLFPPHFLITSHPSFISQQ
jgi:hypothetical protein